MEHCSGYMGIDIVANDGAGLREVLLQAMNRHPLALGKSYADLQLSDEQVRRAEEGVRLARMWEQQQVRRFMRRSELNVERQILLDAERAGAVSVPKALGAIAQDLRAQAMTALEAVAVASQEQQHVVGRGDERCLFEHLSGITDVDEMPASVPPTPRVVLNVDLGDGSAGQLVLCDGDDVNAMASAFVHRHGLPLHTVQALVSQVQVALEEQQRE